MILDLDIGNTRSKWRLSGRAGSQQFSGASATLEAVFTAVEPHRKHIRRIRVANVSGADKGAQLAALASDYCGLKPEFAISQSAWGLVKSAYSDAGSLGVDRWLAICAAFYRAGGSCMVIDAGSALTIDIVDNAGQHEGGYIVPGLQLMQQALLKDTSGVRFPVGWDALKTGLGVNTEQAVKHGILKMAASFIVAVQGDAATCNPRLAVLLTGGDAEVLLPLLGPEVQWMPELVLDGLCLVLP